MALILEFEETVKAPPRIACFGARMATGHGQAKKVRRPLRNPVMPVRGRLAGYWCLAIEQTFFGVAINES